MEPVNQSPRVLGNRYEVGDLLGRGGMAEVHLGRDTRLGRVVAIKLLRTDLARDPVFQARFRREAQSAAGLNHPAIVAVYDTGEESIAESGGGTVALPYIVMEYVEGRTLRDVLREGRPFDVQQALEVTAGVLSALDYSHRMGIVHRDIKPANVMLTAGGDVKVMDFGIARALADVSATMTQTQAVIGTAQYLSPEQARGETVDARSDLYSAGCLLYELITGRPPFVADSPVAVAYQHVREQPHPPSAFVPQIPEVVDRIVLHALAKDREARYQTANEFREDLEAALAGRSVAVAGAAATVAMAAPGQGAATVPATEYLPAPPGASRPYPPVGVQGPAGSMLPGYPGPGGRQDQTYARRGDRRAAAAQNTTGRRIGFAILALAVIALFGGAAYLVSSQVSKNSAANAAVLVRAQSGDLKQDAVNKLTADGLIPQISEKADDRVESGHVITVSPTGSVPRGSTVTLVVSTGSSTLTIPDVHNLTPQDATTKLVQAGFKVSSETQPVPGGGVEKGKVVNTDPPIGDPAAKGSTVTLKVSTGKLTVPNEIGKDVETAKADLKKAGITEEYIKVELVPTTDAPKNQVIDQNIKDTTLDTLKVIVLSVAVPPDQLPTNLPSGSPSDTAGQGGQSSTPPSTSPTP
jgi:serine/threonine-protein kinase